MKPRFWLWPNLLSLDAPLVAVLWQVLFLRCLGASVHWLPALLLFMTVWLIYVADRLLDTRNPTSATPRHAFYRRNFRIALTAWILMLAGTAALVLWGLTNLLLLRGAAMLGAVFIYLAMVHLLPAGRIGWKEAAVAVLFALGTSLPAWGQIRSAQDVLTVALYSMLCWLNCVAIEQWENAAGRPDLPVAAIAGVVAVASLVLLHRDRPILAGAEAASLFALVLLDGLHHKLSRDALRVLADVALLTPLVFLPVAH